MLEDSQFSTIINCCQGCEHKNKVIEQLNKQLTFLHNSQQVIKELSKINIELNNLKSLAYDYRIDISDLAQGFIYALDRLFAIKSKSIVRKGQTIINMIRNLQRLEDKISQDQLTQSITNPQRAFKKEDIGIKTKRQPYKKQEKYIKDNFYQDNLRTQKYNQNNTKKQQLRQSSNFNRESTHMFTQTSLNQSKILENSFSSTLNNFHEDICLPLIWQQTAAFHINGKIITKRHDNDYRKICTQNALPRSGIHILRFQIIKKGTIAFGIVPQNARNGRSIDDKKGAIKYLTFENGGGLLKRCGNELLNSKNIHLQQGEILQIIYNMNNEELIFKNQHLENLFVKMTDVFKNKKIYFFVEMKTEHTAIKMI